MSAARRRLRKLVFWCHLAAGVVVGGVILLMSFTGILLALEHRVYALSIRSHRLSHAQAGTPALPIEDIVNRSAAMGIPPPTSVVVHSEPDLPIEFRYLPDKVLLIDPVTAKSLGESLPLLRSIFGSVLGLHRWLGAAAENRRAGRAITGACNLAFLFLLCSGVYLWWPRQWTRRHLRPVVLYGIGFKGRKRDSNWHTVTGFWCAIPLLVIVSTGVVMSYSWANALVYRLSGSAAPAANRPDRVRFAGESGGSAENLALRVRGWNRAFASAERRVPAWRTITAPLPKESSGPITVSVDRGDGGQPNLRSELTISREGRMVRATNFDDYTAGRRLRMWIRFAHTGEAGGFLGEAIAAIASTGAVFLSLTGLALAFRRMDLWRRRRSVERASEQALSLR